MEVDDFLQALLKSGMQKNFVKRGKFDTSLQDVCIFPIVYEHLPLEELGVSKYVGSAVSIGMYLQHSYRPKHR